jgi:hypothetical protein
MWHDLSDQKQSGPSIASIISENHLRSKAAAEEKILLLYWENFSDI